MKLSSVKIGPKILIVAAAPIMLFLIVCGMAASSITAIVSTGDTVDYATHRLLLAGTAEVDALAMQSSMRGFAATGDQTLLKPYQDNKLTIYKQLTELSDLSTFTLSQKDVIKLAIDQLKEWQDKTAEPIVEQSSTRVMTQAEILTLIQASGTAFADFRATLTKFSDFERNSVDERTITTDNTVVSAYWTLGIGSGLALLVGGLLAVLIGRSIAKPVARLTFAMRDLAAGDTGVTIEGASRGDEIGGMAKATLVFKENAIKVAEMTEEDVARIERNRVERAKMMQDLQRAFGDVVDAAIAGNFSKRVNATFPDAELNNLASSVNSLVETVDRGLSETGDVLSALADTNLTKRMSGNYSGAFAKLKDDTNAVGDKLTEIVTQLRDTSRALKSATGEILAGANDLSERTTKQAATIEETSAAMEQLASTVADNAVKAGEANDKSQAVSLSAEEGGKVMDQATVAMERITTSSSKISNIIGLIDDIAFQTNLLALNASVEAARAGEAGKGFAVVAIEVRRLAQSAAQASKEVKVLIDQSAGEVSTGSKLVADAAGKLVDMLDAVRQNSDLIRAIAAASNQQASAINEVSVAVRQMDEMTQHNAALVEEINASIEQTETQATDLDRIVDVFTVADARSMARKPAAPANKGLQERVKASARSYLTNGNVAIAKDWSEF